MSKFKVCAASVVTVAVFSVCAWAQPPAPAPSSPLQIKPPAPVEKVVATVGDEKITNTELDRVVQSQLRGQPVPPEVMPEIRKSILESMIMNKLVTQFVATKNIKVEASRIDETIAQITKQVTEAGADLPTVLKAQGMTEEGLRKQLASELAVEKYLKAEVTDEKAEEYFNAHKKEFDGTQVKASHILLKYEPASTADEKKAANDKMATIRQEITGGGDFADAAKQHSACPSNAQGGDLGFFARHGQMVEPFAAVAFGLESGGISELVETRFGVHLIKVTEVKPGETKFAEAKDAVTRTLYQQLLEKVAEEQRKVTKVEIAG
jgi:parvulin-like peptidyl-prolyl isomerase